MFGQDKLIERAELEGGNSLIPTCVSETRPILKNGTKISFFKLLFALCWRPLGTRRIVFLRCLILSLAAKRVHSALIPTFWGRKSRLILP